MKNYISDLCLVGGLGLLAYGVSLWTLPGAYVISGVIIMFYGIMLGMRK